MKRGLLVSTAVSAAFLILPALASAASLAVGNSAVSRANTDTYSNFTIIDTNVPVSANGVLDTFTYYAANLNSFEFVLVDSSNVVKYVSPVVTPIATGLQTYSASVLVEAGWNLGVHFDATGTIPFDYAGAPATYTPNNDGMPVVGDVLSVEGTSNRVYSWGATGTAVPSCSGASSFDSFSLGSVNGQGGWSATGSFDQEIIENTFGFTDFGCKTLRISDAITSGSFGDQIFSVPIVNEAGETDALNGGMSSGVRQNHFEAEFDLASTMATLQPGMHLSVSPDRGDGARMSYLRFEDSTDGINVFFDDVQGTTSPATFTDEQIATDLSRSEPHTIKFVMDFVDGSSNDLVKIYIDGILAHTGTSWENYYRFDPESNPTLVSNSRTVDSLLFRESGASHPGNIGFLVDNVALSSSIVLPSTGQVQGTKFFDINGNGVREPDEPTLGGWTINLAGTQSGTQVTDSAGAYEFSGLAAGSYTLSEVMKAGWTQTKAPSAITLVAGQVLTGQDFGNACFVSTGGKGLGFWTNKNGQALETAGDFALLTGLNLVKANGDHQDFTGSPTANKAALKSWFLNASATNMAYMLSAQLAAAELSVAHGLTSGSAKVVVTNPLLAGTPGVSSLGLISVSDLMAAANAELGSHSVTVSPSAFRAYQEALKNTLEMVAGGASIQICPNVLQTFTATNSVYNNGPTAGDPLYATGSISFTWDPVTGNVTGGLYEEIYPANTGTHYMNEVVSGTVTGSAIHLNFVRTVPNSLSFSADFTLSGNTITGTLDGPFYFTATGVVTP
jgi:hypothetical protein